MGRTGLVQQSLVAVLQRQPSKTKEMGSRLRREIHRAASDGVGNDWACAKRGVLISHLAL